MYLLFRYKKTAKELFEAKPNLALVKQLEDAIERYPIQHNALHCCLGLIRYQAVFRAKKEREDRIAHLEGVVAAGGKDAPKAKAELMNLKSHNAAEDSSNEIS